MGTPAEAIEQKGVSDHSSRIIGTYIKTEIKTEDCKEIVKQEPTDTHITHYKDQSDADITCRVIHFSGHLCGRQNQKYLFGNKSPFFHGPQMHSF